MISRRLGFLALVPAVAAVSPPALKPIVFARAVAGKKS